MKRVTVELERYVPASEVFHLAAKEPGCAFLDSSLVNELGRWSILGLRPYKTLVKEQDGSFTEDDVARPDTDFETRLGEFLRLNRDENETALPIVSGAIGYFSYDYGREHMGVPSAEQDVEPIPQARVVFYDLLLIEDCHEKRVWLSACGQRTRLNCSRVSTGTSNAEWKRASRPCPTRTRQSPSPSAPTLKRKNTRRRWIA